MQSSIPDGLLQSFLLFITDEYLHIPLIQAALSISRSFLLYAQRLLCLPLGCSDMHDMPPVCSRTGGYSSPDPSHTRDISGRSLS